MACFEENEVNALGSLQKESVGYHDHTVEKMFLSVIEQKRVDYTIAGKWFYALINVSKQRLMSLARTDHGHLMSLGCKSCGRDKSALEFLKAYFFLLDVKD